MLKLPDVTLVCLDTTCAELALAAVRDCRDQAEFARVVGISDRDITDGQFWSRVSPFQSVEDAMAALWYQPLQFIETSHALFVQWDSGIVDPTAWDDAFLQHDYIGAPWGWHSDRYEVGNGGFSLRSKRLLDYLDRHRDEFPVEPAEDDVLCRKYRPELERRGFRWAPADVASRFARERSVVDGNARHFGYHGIFNWPVMLKGDALAERVRLARASDYVRSRPEFSELEAALHQPVAECESIREQVREGYAHAARQFDEALLTAACDSAVVPIKPNDEAAAQMFRFGCERQRAGDKVDARQFFSAALNCDGDYVPALTNLAVVLREPGKYEASIALLRRAIAEKPDELAPWFNLALTCWRAERYAEAEAAGLRALSLAPDNAAVLANLALVYYATGRADQAVASFERSLAIAPNDFGVRNDHAHAVLKSGDLERGMQLFEVRWEFQMANWGKSIAWECGLPLWQGEDIDGGTLLLHAEQGLGDSLQFAQFIPLIKQKANAGKVILLAPKNLHRLFEGRCGIDVLDDNSSPGAVVRGGRAAVAHAPLISAFAALGLSYDAMPKPRPYLSAVTECPRDFHAGGARLAIGVVWAASPGHERSRQRSVPVADLLELAAIPGVRLWSLQMGPYAADAVETGADALIGNAMGDVTDYADTAAIVEKLDLVVAVDTSIVHLVGAMGKPCFMFNPVNACWRWARGASPWYTSVELFDQAGRGEWTAPIMAMKERIAAMVAERMLLAEAA